MPQATYAADGIPAVDLVFYARETTVSVSEPENSGVGDDTFMLFPPTFILTRRNVLYLSSEVPRNREPVDECALPRNSARQRANEA